MMLTRPGARNSFGWLAKRLTNASRTDREVIVTGVVATG
jgi:hypothetical protein